MDFDVLKLLYLEEEIYWLLHKGYGKRLLLLMSNFGGLSCVERERETHTSLALPPLWAAEINNKGAQLIRLK